MLDDLTSPGVPAGGPCQLEFLVTFKAGTDARLSVAAALDAVYGDSIVSDPSGGAHLGGQLARFAWRVKP